MSYRVFVMTTFYETPAKANELAKSFPNSQAQDQEQAKKWQGLVRASILSANTQKLFNYINLADQKAMGVIILNSIIIPVVLGKVGLEDFKIAATISIVACVISMFTAMICIFPKRRSHLKPNGQINPLHFSDIGRLSEEQYLDVMLPLYNNPPMLGVAVLQDLHDVSRNVLRPKFIWLKLSYVVFFFGNLTAIIVELLQLWFPF